ncbi:flagellin [Roseivivax isoporae]|uniref:Flagellin n=1 Tax=Roseivivax isoporae LMG 25204 TaxID=1449351 RepID=X7FCB8_9RHOB|nr:flagellin [Roseivivax isoporae]ETX29699.1 flagellin [Roseivivax isoporae LMG 25204]
MSSILTNNGAMIALQTLKSINKGLQMTQNEVATGKSVATAKDNSAVWAISKVMEADVKGFKGISDSLNLGESTVAVARQAAETVTDLLTDIKGKIVAAQEENVDRVKIQADISALRDQIASVVGAAQFNGLNLLSNTDTTAGSGNINILSSLDRSSSNVVASDISVAKQDLGTTASAIDYTATATAANADLFAFGTTAAQAATAVNTAANATLTINIGSEATAGAPSLANFSSTDPVAAGLGFQLIITASGGNVPAAFNTTDGDITYVARDGDTAADVATGLADAFNRYARTKLGEDNVGSGSGLIQATVGANGFSLVIEGYDGVAGDTFSVNAEQFAATATTIGGRLEQLTNVDVTTQAGADNALTEIEALIQTAIDSASAFGSAQGRIETQTDFISGLTTALKSGIGTLVDADMEEASARLQALQVQQQLGVQALSIANQAPQQLLSLFR